MMFRTGVFRGLRHHRGHRGLQHQNIVSDHNIVIDHSVVMTTTLSSISRVLKWGGWGGVGGGEG